MRQIKQLWEFDDAVQQRQTLLFKTPLGEYQRMHSAYMCWRPYTELLRTLRGECYVWNLEQGRMLFKPHYCKRNFYVKR